MNQRNWEIVDLKQAVRSSGKPLASIGQGRLALNAAACDLINNIYDYEWVTIMQSKERGRVIEIGLRFSNQKESNSLHVARRKYKGKNVGGLNINSRQLVKKYFGETKEPSTSRYSVEKVDSKTLAVNIIKEL